MKTLACLMVVAQVILLAASNGQAQTLPSSKAAVILGIPTIQLSSPILPSAF